MIRQNLFSRWNAVDEEEPFPFAYLTRPAACFTGETVFRIMLPIGDPLAIVYIPVPVDLDGSLSKEIIRRTWANKLAKLGIRVSNKALESNHTIGRFCAWNGRKERFN